MLGAICYQRNETHGLNNGRFPCVIPAYNDSARAEWDCLVSKALVVREF
jgi:hypothetical protein